MQHFTKKKTFRELYDSVAGLRDSVSAGADPLSLSKSLSVIYVSLLDRVSVLADRLEEAHRLNSPELMRHATRMLRQEEKIVNILNPLLLGLQRNLQTCLRMNPPGELERTDDSTELRNLKTKCLFLEHMYEMAQTYDCEMVPIEKLYEFMRKAQDKRTAANLAEDRDRKTAVKILKRLEQELDRIDEQLSASSGKKPQRDMPINSEANSGPNSR